MNARRWWRKECKWRHRRGHLRELAGSCRYGIAGMAEEGFQVVRVIQR